MIDVGWQVVGYIVVGTVGLSSLFRFTLDMLRTKEPAVADDDRWYENWWWDNLPEARELREQQARSREPRSRPIKNSGRTRKNPATGIWERSPALYVEQIADNKVLFRDLGQTDVKK